MFRSGTEMNTCSAAGFGGWFTAAMTRIPMMIADTVFSVAAVFFRGAVSGVRPCRLLPFARIGGAPLMLCASPAPMR